MNLKKYILGAIPVLVFLGLISFDLFGCKKTAEPLGLVAPHGFDFPTLTPTPEVGSFEVYVSDTNVGIQGVTVILVNPSGVTVGYNQTQPVVGYAAFNPPSINNGVWNAIVPAQSVSYVTAGPVTIKKSYGTSVVPINVTGGGQYSVTFSTGHNSVAISPVSQITGTALPYFNPCTINYTENGNLDVPVSVTISGYPGIAGFTLSTSPNMVMGGGTTVAPVTIIKNTCYYPNINLALAAFDFSGTSIASTGASIVRGWSIPVTLFMDKNALSGGYEYCTMQVGSSQDCGNALYSLSYQIQTINPPGGSVTTCGGLSNGGSCSVTYQASLDPYVRAVLSYPGGSIVGDVQMQSLTFGSYSNMGSANF